eukprot:5524508-Alexandrium_andersonii.AAC.1
MSASLVGSEMCIRDSLRRAHHGLHAGALLRTGERRSGGLGAHPSASSPGCAILAFSLAQWRAASRRRRL